MVKDNWPPQVWLTSISPKILKFRFSLNIKRWFTPTGMTDQYYMYDLNLRIILDMVKDDWPAIGMTDQDLT